MVSFSLFFPFSLIILASSYLSFSQKVNVCRCRSRGVKTDGARGARREGAESKIQYTRHLVAGRSKSSDCLRVADQASVQKLAVDVPATLVKVHAWAIRPANLISMQTT